MTQTPTKKGGHAPVNDLPKARYWGIKMCMLTFPNIGQHPILQPIVLDIWFNHLFNPKTDMLLGSQFYFLSSNMSILLHVELCIVQP